MRRDDSVASMQTRENKKTLKAKEKCPPPSDLILYALGHYIDSSVRLHIYRCRRCKELLKSIEGEIVQESLEKIGVSGFGAEERG